MPLVLFNKMPIIIKRANVSIRIWSVWADEIRNLFIKSKTRKVYILLYALAWPLYIMAWLGNLMCFVFILFVGFYGLYSFFSQLFSPKPQYSFFVIIGLLFSLIFLYASVRYFIRLRLLFKSGQIPIEELLPMIGLILFGLIGAVIYFAC